METVISQNTARTRLAEIDQALRRRDIGHASQMIARLTREEPGFVEGWISAARLAQMAGDYDTMRAHLRRALTLAPGSPLIRLMDAEAQVHSGEVRSAHSTLIAMEEDAKTDPAWLGRVSEAYTHCGDFLSAERCARSAVNLDPANPHLRFALSAALIATGKLTDAETELDLLIASNPHEYDAWYNRSTLRKQTEDANHVDALKDMLAQTRENPAASIQLNYALAHELEDLGRFEESFLALKAGADARRAMMSYRVEKDVGTMAEISETFDADFFSANSEGCTQSGPVFILGLPRSGTTLTDRILSAHKDVESLGELNDFPLALTALCRKKAKGQGLVRLSATLNMRELGEAYLHRVRQRASGSLYFIDKAPANFLYIGLIAAALPNAKIIHLNRDPVDNALGMYKALFRMGYPFSYAFDDLAKYMRAKNQLMDHWRRVLPDRIIDMHYEDIVSDQEAQTRRLLKLADLDWDRECLNFHRNTSPSATASAAQVRRPIYESSVGRWRHYKTQLQPLIKALEDPS